MTANSTARLPRTVCSQLPNTCQFSINSVKHLGLQKGAIEIKCIIIIIIKYDTKEVESKKSKIGVPWMERDMFRGAVSQKSLGTTGLDCHTCTDGSAKRSH